MKYTSPLGKMFPFSLQLRGKIDRLACCSLDNVHSLSWDSEIRKLHLLFFLQQIREVVYDINLVPNTA